MNDHSKKVQEEFIDNVINKFGKKSDGLAICYKADFYKVLLLKLIYI